MNIFDGLNGSFVIVFVFLLSTTERLKCSQDRAQLISYQLTQGRGKIAKMLHVVINISMNNHRGK